MINNSNEKINELIKNNKEFKNLREMRLKNIVKIISQKGLKDKEKLFEIEEYKMFDLKENEILSIEKLYYQKEIEEISEEEFLNKKKQFIDIHIENKINEKNNENYQNLNIKILGI
jgi:hypothetical protein